MILSKKERTNLQKIIQGVLQNSKNPSYGTNLLFVILVLIADFEELENVLSKAYSIFASGKEITELLDSLSENLSSDLIEKLHFEGQSELIKNLSLLANNAQDLKFILAGLHDEKLNIPQ